MNGAATCSEALRECLAALSTVSTRQQIETWIEANYPGKWKPSTIVAHLYGCSINNPKGIQHHPSFPRVVYAHGNGRYELYEPAKHGVYEDGLPVGEDAHPDAAVPREEFESHTDAAEANFAYEAHLRDYLARNLHILESGLSLWDANVEIEYAVAGRRIDILAKDKHGVPVVIELKVSKGHERTIGQCLYYRGKLKELLGVSSVRIFIVAGEISEELCVSCRELVDVTLYEYSLSMTVVKMNGPAAKC